MNLDRISTLLASGLKPSQVATIIGVSPARISQLLSNEEFKLRLEAKMAEQKEIDIEEQAISSKYSAAEHLLLDNIMEVAPTADLRDMVGALKVIAERQERMKSRTAVQAPALHQQLTVVSVSLPTHALQPPKVVYNKAQEVISIGDKALAPMSSTAVAKMFSSLSKKGDSHEPSSSNPSPEAGPVEDIPHSTGSSSEEVTSSLEDISFLAYAGRQSATSPYRNNC